MKSSNSQSSGDACVEICVEVGPRVYRLKNSHFCPAAVLEGDSKELGNEETTGGAGLFGQGKDLRQGAASAK